MCCSLQGSGGKTPEKQTTPRGKDFVTLVADNDEIKGAAVQSTGGSAVTPSRYCAIASLDEAAFDEEVKIYFLNFFCLFAKLSRFQNIFFFFRNSGLSVLPSLPKSITNSIGVMQEIAYCTLPMRP